jgi:hypothetical protein
VCAAVARDNNDAKANGSFDKSHREVSALGLIVLPRFANRVVLLPAKSSCEWLDVRSGRAGLGRVRLRGNLRPPGKQPDNVLAWQWCLTPFLCLARVL